MTRLTNTVGATVYNLIARIILFPKYKHVCSQKYLFSGLHITSKNNKKMHNKINTNIEQCHK